jgi:hypothetical protein
MNAAKGQSSYVSEREISADKQPSLMLFERVWDLKEWIKWCALSFLPFELESEV